MFTIEDMHYDFKQKLNKVDSQKWRNLKIQEIDWKLNEAMELRVKTIAEPRYAQDIGLEFNQRSIDEISAIVKDSVSLVLTPFGDNKSFSAALPDDYWFTASVTAFGSKGNCTNQKIDAIPRNHNDRHEDSPFDNSDFEWRETNFVYYKNGMRFFTDGTFNVDTVLLDYLIRPPYMHYAAGVQGGTYNLPNGTTLSGRQDCILNDGIRREVVDIAVAIASGDLDMNNYQVKLNKLKMND